VPSLVLAHCGVHIHLLTILSQRSDSGLPSLSLVYPAAA
jgi:hypothetical protein